MPHYSKLDTSKAPGRPSKAPQFTTLSAAVHESEAGFHTQGELAHAFTVSRGSFVAINANNEHRESCSCAGR